MVLAKLNMLHSLPPNPPRLPLDCWPPSEVVVIVMEVIVKMGVVVRVVWGLMMHGVSVCLWHCGPVAVSDVVLVCSDAVVPWFFRDVSLMCLDIVALRMMRLPRFEVPVCLLCLAARQSSPLLEGFSSPLLVDFLSDGAWVLHVPRLRHRRPSASFFLVVAEVLV